MTSGFSALVSVFVTVMNCDAWKFGKNPSIGLEGFGEFIGAEFKPAGYYRDKSCDKEPNLESAVDRFVSIYTKVLENTLTGKLMEAEDNFGKRREGLPLEDDSIAFEHYGREKLSGSFTMLNIGLNFGNVSESRDDRVCLVLEKGKEIPLGINYILDFISISFEYIVSVSVRSERMSGSAQAILEDQHMWSYILVEEKDGSRSCTYNDGNLHLHVTDTDFDRYRLSFETTQGFRDPGMTKRIEKIMNTLIMRHVFNYASLYTTVKDALNGANENALSRAAAQYRQQTNRDLCDAMKS